MRLKGLQLATILLVLTLGTGAHLTPAGPGLSVTGVSLEFHRVAALAGQIVRQLLPERSALDAFVDQVANGNAAQVVGVHAPELFSLPVLQQPANNPGFVASQPGVVTQFDLAAQYGTTGLMAHNNLAGSMFYYVSVGQQIDLVYGDGSVKHFLVTDIQRYQALSPNSPYSDFVNLDGGGSRIGATQLFYQIYNSRNPLVLQTCLANNGILSWGRLFITAVPYEPPARTALALALN